VILSKFSPLKNIRRGADAAVVAAGRAVDAGAAGQRNAEQSNKEVYGVFFAERFHDITLPECSENGNMLEQFAFPTSLAYR
jgi:hypothetical protein